MTKTFLILILIFYFHLFCHTVPPVLASSTYASDVNEDSPFGIHNPKVIDMPGLKPLGFDEAKDLQEVGAKWARYAGGEGLVWDVIERQRGIYDWSRTDFIFSDAYKRGVNLIVVINCANRLDHPGFTTAPEDLEWYLKFLRAAVERYNGDGVDDAPGSPVVNYWEIENEVDLNGFWTDTPGNYAKLLKESYRVIKEANPKAKVSIAAMAGVPKHMMQQSYRYYDNILSELESVGKDPNDRYFDLFGVHLYNFAGDQLQRTKQHINTVEAMLKKYGYFVPIWLTETGNYSGQPYRDPFGLAKDPLHTEKEQAIDLIKIYIYSIANNIKKVFWVTLTEWSGYMFKNSLWDNVGLIHNIFNRGFSHKKLSYYTYKNMVKKLEGSSWDKIQIIQENELYIYKFKKSNKIIWVLWNNSNDINNIELSGLNTNEVEITESVPKYKNGYEVTNENNDFTILKLPVKDGNVTVTVTDIPVFMEEK